MCGIFGMGSGELWRGTADHGLRLYSLLVVTLWLNGVADAARLPAAAR